MDASQTVKPSLGWFKLALQIVERFGKSFPARFGKSRYKLSSKPAKQLNRALILMLNFLSMEWQPRILNQHIDRTQREKQQTDEKENRYEGKTDCAWNEVFAPCGITIFYVNEFRLTAP